MNKHTVALCYPQGVSPATLELVRAKTTGFGYRAEYLVPHDSTRDAMGRILTRLMRGYDLLIIVCDETLAHTEYITLGHWNHLFDDPYAMMTIAVASKEWKGPQPTIAVESVRYLDYHHIDALPSDLLALLQSRRRKLYDRGLSDNDWSLIESQSGTKVRQTVVVVE